MTGQIYVLDMYHRSVMDKNLTLQCMYFLSTVSRSHNYVFHPIALRRAKTLWSFGCSECNRVIFKIKLN